MQERRKVPRLEDENEITITVVSGENTHKKMITHDNTKDISVSGAGIQTHIILPVDTILTIDMTLKTVRQMVTVLGKVKWIRVIIEDESYEAGVEFFSTPGEAFHKLADYISWKQKFKSLNPV
jgi:hypothetical protein